jgi:predicted ribonuclease YlaK
MSRKRKSTANVGISTTFKNKRKPQLITLDNLVELQPLTANQEKLFDFYDKGKNIIAHGVPGSGKSLCAIYKALEDVLDTSTPYRKVVIVRSIVPTRDIGFLKGSIEDKYSQYEKPYKNMLKCLFEFNTEEEYELLYGNLKAQRSLDFISTSFERGDTYEDSIIIVDEFQNANFHELCTLITRLGKNSKIMFCGDIMQSDLTRQNERNGASDFIRILKIMKSFEFLEFQIEDIVRSELVKEFIIAKHELGL